jgi:hypothetical protein
MTALEIIQKKFEYGFPIFQKIFDQPAVEVRKTLLHLVELHASHLPKDFILNGRVEKISVDDDPRDIFVSWNDSYQINFQGVFFIKEHHSPELVIQFTEHFTL